MQPSCVQVTASIAAGVHGAGCGEGLGGEKKNKRERLPLGPLSTCLGTPVPGPAPAQHTALAGPGHPCGSLSLSLTTAPPTAAPPLHLHSLFHGAMGRPATPRQPIGKCTKPLLPTRVRAPGPTDTAGSTRAPNPCSKKCLLSPAQEDLAHSNWLSVTQCPMLTLCLSSLVVQVSGLDSGCPCRSCLT